MSASQEKSSSQGSGLPEPPSKGLNKQIAVVSTLAAVGLFLSSRLDFGVSLKDLTAAALPYEEVSQIFYTLYDFAFISFSFTVVHLSFVWYIKITYAVLYKMMQFLMLQTRT